MPTYRLAYNKETKTVQVAATGTAIPGGSVAIGNIVTPDPVYPGSTVMWHAIRDVLYKRKASNPAQVAMFPENITDMDHTSITVLKATSIDITAAGGDLAVGATRQSVVTVLPAGSVDAGGVTYESSDPTKATVSATGLITAVAIGTATITARTADGAFKDTVDITVIAA